MKMKSKGLDQNKHTKRTNTIFAIVIVLFAFLLYGNTIKNQYSLDDYIIRDINTQLSEKGISYFAEIFVTPYTTVSSGDEITKSFGYRPLSRLVYATEFAIVNMIDGGDRELPGVSHVVNILFYAILALLIFVLLRRIFRNYSIWFPFAIVLLFVAHPVHTEVVASIKNRDELISGILSVMSLIWVLKYSDTSKTRFLIFGLISYLLAFYAKPTAFAFWLIFPLVLYFFTDMKAKKIAMISGLFTLILLIGSLSPFLIIDWQRDFSIVDNPLYVEESFWNILGTGILSLGYYLKLVAFPHPLLYYYGYDMIPVSNLANIWVILTILAYASLIAVAFYKIRQKHIVSFGILFFMFTIAMYSNIGYPVPGIIGERFLLIPSLGFCILLAWLIFTIFKVSPGPIPNAGARIFTAMVFIIIILLPYSYKTISRNNDWYTGLSLYKADMKYLDKSVKAHDLMGTSLMNKIERELLKKVNVAKFIMPDIEKAIYHFSRAVEILPEHTSSWTNLGMIYNHPRIGDHLIAKGDTAEFLRYKRSAVSSFKRAIDQEAGNGKALFNLGITYENIGITDSAEYFYEKCIEYNPQIIFPRSRLGNLRFMKGDVQGAIDLNEEIMYIDAKEAIPYLNIGNYYMIMGDTLQAIVAFEQAAERNARPELYAFLSEYYRSMGNMQKAQEYRIMQENATNRLLSP